MLNYLWAGMILVGIIFGAFNGKMPDITNAALDSSKEAVTLCITMIGVMSFWTGIMEIASEAGVITMAARKMRPLIRFLFPNIPQGHKANEHITTNFIANFLGLGWAATPAGLKAMEELEKLEEERRRKKAPGQMRSKGIASNEMCSFLILNISSLQLVSVNVIAYRSQYGSVNPAAIVGAGIIATAVSTGAAVIFCKIMDRKRNVDRR
ncbi:MULTISPECIES: nucleoside recognition protein [Lachnospiraceae]|jgi:spore maturation protein A|uniref:Nucleoside recognition protein n=1 Tax=Faecalicatena acetigenes TaxID=2981790 RepID=A0ABT2T9F0_9FIRM|nr:MULTISPECIES: nucleoside recognition protein [Lachnospiraceae]MCU6746895.1 nucleoside recognition protein [Faecalicatena acetigenes]RGT72862.1 nucleoside recognition protein [Ruminococcus sp. AF18-22]SCH49800.1 Spore maturation protein A [uncultured Clostridium sp.]